MRTAINIVAEEPLFCLFSDTIISESWCVKLFLKAINGVLKDGPNKGYFPTDLIVPTWCAVELFG